MVDPINGSQSRRAHPLLQHRRAHDLHHDRRRCLDAPRARADLRDRAAHEGPADRLARRRRLGAFGQIFVGAIELAAPAMLALIITDVAFGMVSRVVPQLNVFAVGFPMKVGVALLVVAGSARLRRQLALRSAHELGRRRPASDAGSPDAARRQDRESDTRNVARKRARRARSPRAPTSPAEPLSSPASSPSHGSARPPSRTVAGSMRDAFTHIAHSGDVTTSAGLQNLLMTVLDTLASHGRTDRRRVRRGWRHREHRPGRVPSVADRDQARVQAHQPGHRGQEPVRQPDRVRARQGDRQGDGRRRRRRDGAHPSRSRTSGRASARRRARSGS